MSEWRRGTNGKERKCRLVPFISLFVSFVLLQSGSKGAGQGKACVVAERQDAGQDERKVVLSRRRCRRRQDRGRRGRGGSREGQSAVAANGLFDGHFRACWYRWACQTGELLFLLVSLAAALFALPLMPSFHGSSCLVLSCLVFLCSLLRAPPCEEGAAAVILRLQKRQRALQSGQR